jgi:hypothetical protein
MPKPCRKRRAKSGLVVVDGGTLVLSGAGSSILFHGQRSQRGARRSEIVAASSGKPAVGRRARHSRALCALGAEAWRMAEASSRDPLAVPPANCTLSSPT